MDSSSKTLVLWIYSALMVSLATSYSGRMNCRLPDDWHGQWYLDGRDPVIITTTTVSGVGTCTQQNGSGKFLLMNSDGCFKCMAFNQKHRNLLQYKISYCGESDRLEDVCDSIENDAMLHTMVKENGEPIPCPFQGPWEFSYTNRSNPECDRPKSHIAACADESKSQINFRRCTHLGPSVYFDRMEQIQCLATWYTGHDHYLYGKFTNSDLSPSKSPYRCFMYTVTGRHGTMSMSSGAACNELQSSEIGPVTFKLYFRLDLWPQPGMQVPQFFPAKSKWRDVRGRLMFEVNGRGEIFTVSDIPGHGVSRPETRRRVVSMGDTDVVKNARQVTVDMLAFVTDDQCESASACIRFTQHSDRVVQVQIGHSAKDDLSACEATYFNNVPNHVLIPYDPVPVECPMPGVHSYKDLGSGCTGTLKIGCQDQAEIEVEGRCDNQQAVDVLQCYAHWKDTSTMYVLARKLNDERKAAYCLVFQHRSDGYLLESSAECGVATLTIMGHPIKFAVDPNTSTCTASASRPLDRKDTNHPRDSRDQGSAGSYHTNDQAGGGRGGSGDTPEVIKRPSGTGLDTRGSGPRKTSGVINADDDDRNGASSLFSGFSASSIVLLLVSLSITMAAHAYSTHR